MPFGTQTQWRREALPRPEILSYPLETTVIDSVVVNATGVTPDPSTSPYWNRRYLVAGTILSTASGNQYEQYTAASGQVVAGVLFDTVEFADNSSASDEPVAMLRRNVSFKKDKIVDFVTHQSALETALDTCEFI